MRRGGKTNTRVLSGRYLDRLAPGCWALKLCFGWEIDGMAVKMQLPKSKKAWVERQTLPRNVTSVLKQILSALCHVRLFYF
jgi:hypothetical protein